MPNKNDLSVGEQPTQRGGGPLDVSMGEVPTDRPGRGRPLGRVDRYVLKEKLGQGGFGAVYRALDEEAGVEVALKALPPLISHNPEELESVRRNFALVTRLVHSNIANVRHLHRVVQADAAARDAFGVESGDYLVVMEYVPGSTLSGWVHMFPECSVPVFQALEMVRQVGAALDFAHAQKIIHRDIKPGNVMVCGEKYVVPRGTTNLNIKVLDFGLAAEIRSSMSRVSQEQGDTSGTRPYMAPEQWAGQRQGPATDQYALAVMFYELVSGAVPFASAFQTGDPVVMLNVVEHKIPEALAELDKQQNAALLKALAKNPDDRFEDCSDFVGALSGHREKPHRRGRIVVFLLLLIGLAAGILVLRRPRDSVGVLAEPAGAKNEHAVSTMIPPGQQADPEPINPVLDPEREIAIQQRSLTGQHRASAQNVQAQMLAPKDWQAGVASAVKAGELFESGHFAEASNHWKTAAENFQRSEVNALGKARVATARSSYIEQLKLLKNSLSVDELGSFDSNKLAEAKALADQAGELENKKQWDAAVAKFKAAKQCFAEAFHQTGEQNNAGRASNDWNPGGGAAASAFSELDAEAHKLEREQLLEDAAALKETGK